MPLTEFELKIPVFELPKSADMQVMIIYFSAIKFSGYVLPSHNETISFSIYTSRRLTVKTCL